MDRKGTYQIRVRDEVDPEWSSWFGDLVVHKAPDGMTTIEGVVADQAALHGVLARIRDLGLELVAVERIDGAGPSLGSRQKGSDEDVH